MIVVAACRAAALSTLIVLAATVGAAQASTIQIDDLTDVITVTVDGTTVPVTLLPGASEAIMFTFVSSVNAGVTGTFSRDLLEASKGGVATISDRLRLEITQGSNIITVQFASDPDLARVPPGSVSYTGIDEMLRFQDVLYFARPTDTSSPFPMATVPPDGVVIDTFQVRSDPEVPEPASLTLLGLGLAGLVARRRQKKT
jgi:hypothetical protein